MSEKKKILFVRPTLGYGGADRVTLNLLKGFDRQQYACDLALMRAEGEFVKDVPQDINVINLRASSLWRMWKPLKKLVSFSDYDIIYSTCGGASMPMMLSIWLSDFKGISVVSERNVIFRPGKSRSKRWLMIYLKRWLYKKATFVTAVSKGVRQETIEVLKTDSSKTIVVNNPIINTDLSSGMVDQVDHPFFQAHEKVILAVGRFEWQKDYTTLLKAFQKVREVNKEVGLFILGEGPLANDMKQQARALGLNNAVCFAGFDKNPYKYMANCDVYVLSSLHEGMPGVLVQAMACGAPVVSTDCPTGPNELIKDGENGFLVPVQSPEILAVKILELLSDQKIALTFSQTAPKAVDRFKENEAIASYFDFLG